MTTLVTRAAGTAVLSAFVLMPNLTTAQENPDPHWNKDSCQACHLEAASAAGRENLRQADTEELCGTCHGKRGNARSCRHLSGISQGGLSVSEPLVGSLKNDQIVCSTCHDVVYQCENATIGHSYVNPGFLRDRASPDSAEFCSKCHDSSALKKLDPHAGIVGTPPRPSCLLCHAEIPQTSSTGRIVVEFNMRHDLNDACRGCHDVRPHPVSVSFGMTKPTEEWVHLVTPSSDVLDNMNKSRTETGIGLPLDPLDGKIICATCHNPHDFKIGGESGSQSKEIRHRLRLEDVCQACHDK